MVSTRSLLSGSLLFVALPALGCSGDSLTVPETAGTLAITTSISGPEPDADGFSVQIDGGPAQPIGATATLTTPELTPGDHTVQLSDMAGNCSVAGDNPRTVSVTAGETATVTFAVTCGVTTASLSIAAVTSGPSPDADGYTISIDGADRGPLAANGTVTVDALTAGSHSVGLSGIAANCQVQGENVQAVTVTAGANASVAYTIACVAPPADAGSIRITTATSGADPDPDGYTFSVDGGAAQPIAVNANTTLPNLAAGAHSVRLAGASGNCSIAGPNPRPVAVTSGGTADAAFVISCSATTATTGSIKITTATTGSSPDAGYEVSVDGGSSQGIGSNAELTISNVATGDRSVTLGGLASNCTLQGSNPRTVSVTAGAQASVTFALTCTSAGVQWRTIPFRSGFVGVALWASSPSDVFVLGSYWNGPTSGPRQVLHYDGSSWSEQSLGATAIWGRSPTDVYAAGGSLVWHYDGSRWVEVHDGFMANYQALWGSSGTGQGLFSAGWDDAHTPAPGLIDQYDGTMWSRMEGHGFNDSNTEVSDLAGTSPIDVYALGPSGGC